MPELPPAAPEPEKAIGARLVPETIDVKGEAVRLARVSQSARLAFERNRLERSLTMRGWAMLAGFVGLLIIPTAIFPQQITTLFSGAASLYAKAGVKVNTRGLEFRTINYKRILNEGVLTLVIEGAIANISDHSQTLPPLRIAIMDKGGQSLFSWTLDVEPGVLAPTSVAGFSSRLASPPGDGALLQVRFARPNEAKPEL